VVGGWVCARCRGPHSPRLAGWLQAGSLARGGSSGAVASLALALARVQQLMLAGWSAVASDEKLLSSCEVWGLLLANGVPLNAGCARARGGGGGDCWGSAATHPAGMCCGAAPALHPCLTRPACAPCGYVLWSSTCPASLLDPPCLRTLPLQALVKAHLEGRELGALVMGLLLRVGGRGCVRSAWVAGW
jgi:hypothetical protein